MTAPNAGSASVSIVPDLRGFAEKLTAELLPGMRELGDQIGREIGSGISEQVGHDIDQVRAKLDALGLKQVNVDVDVDDHGSAAAAAARVEAIGAAGGGSSGGLSALTTGILALGPAAVGAAAAAIPAILAIGAAISGAVAGVGVLALGFSGIGEALSAAGKPSTGGGGGSSSAGLSAQSQEISARQATQAAADQLTAAVRRQEDAETSLTRAQREATDAQQALTAARKQAQQDLIDLANKVTDNSLAQRDAAIKLAQAKSTLETIEAAPGAGLAQYASQVAQAQLDYDKAKQNVNELATQGQRLGDQQKAANAAGVNGAAGVVSAQAKLIDTQVALRKAQQDNTDAAHKLAEAQQNIIDTAARNAIAAQQAANGMTAAAGGTNAFADAMAKLNPLQREFVDYILTLKPLFEDLKTAASGFLPGLQAGIQDALPAFKPLLDLVGAVAKALGGAFVDIGKGIASGEGQKFLKFLTTELPGQITFLGQVFIQVGRIFAGIFETFAPLIKTVDDSFLGFLKDFGDAAQNGGLASFAKFLQDLLPQVSPAVKAIGTLFVAALKAIGPAIGPSLKLVTVLADELVNLGEPVVRPLAELLGALVTALLPLIPLFEQLIQAVLPPLIDFLTQLVNQGIAPLVTALVAGLAPVMPTIAKAFSDFFTALTPLIPVFADIFVKTVQILAPLLPKLVTAVANMAVAFANLLVQLAPVIGPLTELMLRIFTESTINNMIRVANAITAILNAMTGLARDIAGLVKKVSDAFGGFKDGVVGVFKDAGTWLYDVGKDIVSGIIQGIKDKAGDLVQALKDFVIDKIPGPIRKALKIGSPSKLMADEIGRWIPAGIAEGILANLGIVPKALDSVLASVSKFSANPVNLNTGAIRVASQQVGASIGANLPIGGGGTVFNNRININQPLDAQAAGHAIIARVMMRGT